MKMQKEEIFGWDPDHVSSLSKLFNGFYFTPSNSVLTKAHKTPYFVFCCPHFLSLYHSFLVILAIFHSRMYSNFSPLQFLFWQLSPINIYMAHTITSMRSTLKCHLISDFFSRPLCKTAISSPPHYSYTSPLFYVACILYDLLILFTCLHPLEYSLQEGADVCLFSSMLYPKHPEICQAHSGCSTNFCWTNVEQSAGILLENFRGKK